MAGHNQDDGSEKTTIKVSRETWQRLTQRKEAPGDTYNQVVKQLLEEVEGAEEGNPNQRTGATAN